MIYYIYIEQEYKSLLPVQIMIDRFRSNGFQIDVLIFNLKIDFINNNFLLKKSI